MAKLPPMTVREVETILERAGFELDRHERHRVWVKGERSLPVPAHPGDLKIGTLRSIVKVLRHDRRGVPSPSSPEKESSERRRFSVVLASQPEGGYTVTSPDILDLVTQGETREKAIEMAIDCAEVPLESYLARDLDLPEEGGRAELATIEVDLDEIARRVAEERMAVPA